MDKKSLVARRSEVERLFDKQNTTKAATEQELYRLQGEFRLLTELIDELEAEGPQQSEAGDNE